MTTNHTFILLCCFAVVLFICMQENHSQTEESLSGELVIREIAADAFLIIHSFPWPGNSLFVRLNNQEGVWIDTPYTPEATSIVLDWIYRKFGREIRITEINTGFHIDNLGGNKELIDKGIPVYGSQLTCDLLKTRSRATMLKILDMLKAPKYKKYHDVYRSFVFYEPTILFDVHEGKNLQFDNERVEIFYPGPTHTYDNLVVYIPGKKILFGGCMVLSADAKAAGFMDDGDIKLWPIAIRKVAEKYKDASLIVPGHGYPGDHSLFAHTLEILKKF